MWVLWVFCTVFLNRTSLLVQLWLVFVHLCTFCGCCELCCQWQCSWLPVTQDSFCRVSVSKWPCRVSSGTFIVVIKFLHWVTWRWTLLTLSQLLTCVWDDANCLGYNCCQTSVKRSNVYSNKCKVVFYIAQTERTLVATVDVYLGIREIFRYWWCYGDCSINKSYSGVSTIPLLTLKTFSKDILSHNILNFILKVNLSVIICK